MLMYCLDRRKTREMCDEAVDDCLEALKFSDWFVTSKVLEKFYDALLANDDILFFSEDFSKVTCFTNEVGILGVDLDNINLDNNNNFDEDNPETIIHVRLLAWRNIFEKCKSFKKDKGKKLMLWHGIQKDIGISACQKMRKNE